MPKKKPVRRSARKSKGKRLQTFLMDVLDTSPNKSPVNPFGMTTSVLRKQYDASSAAVAIRRFSLQIDRQFNLKEVRTDKYPRFVVTAMPAKANPQHVKNYPVDEEYLDRKKRLKAISNMKRFDDAVSKGLL